MKSRRDFIMTSLAALGAASRPVCAQSFPSQPVHMIVPFPPGGGTDALARAIQEPLQKAIGQTVVIDNKGGVVVGLCALQRFLRANPQTEYGLRWICSPNEEMGSIGFTQVFYAPGLIARLRYGG